jgi:hypothetical protein
MGFSILTLHCWNVIKPKEPIGFYELATSHRLSIIRETHLWSFAQRKLVELCSSLFRENDPKALAASKKVAP